MKLPLCINPKQLRARWDWLEQKYEELKPKQEVEDIKISEEAQSIFDELKDRHWPKGSKEQLPQVIQASLDEYQKVYREVNRFVKRKFKFDKDTGDYLYKSNGQPKQERNNCERMLWVKQAMTSPSTFVENWFRDLNKRVQGWDKWKGDLFNQRIKREDVIKYIRQLTSDYSGSSTAADSIMELLNASRKD